MLYIFRWLIALIYENGCSITFAAGGVRRRRVACLRLQVVAFTTGYAVMTSAPKLTLSVAASWARNAWQRMFATFLMLFYENGQLILTFQFPQFGRLCVRWILLKKTIKYAEIIHSKRWWFIRSLRKWVQKHGSDNVVYFDESGFEAHCHRNHGWAKRGKQVHGKVTGNKKKDRTNLIMAQRKKEWIAPMLFKGGCTHQIVRSWIEKFLLPELRPNSLIIMDNAPFHNKPLIKELLEKHGHTLMPLPTYSPDLNPIEQSFAIIKKRRIFSEKSLEDIICRNY